MLSSGKPEPPFSGQLLLSNYEANQRPMLRKLAKPIAFFLLVSYGLIAVVGSGGAHWLSGIVHSGSTDFVSCSHCCHGHDHEQSSGASCPVAEEPSGSGTRVGSSSLNEHCPICHWFAQCKSYLLIQESEAAGSLRGERFSVYRQRLFDRSLYRPSRPRGPPAQG